MALGRIQAIEKFKMFIDSDASESKVIQPFLEKFPWILDSRITTFEREVHFRDIYEETLKMIAWQNLSSLRFCVILLMVNLLLLN